MNVDIFNMNEYIMCHLTWLNKVNLSSKVQPAAQIWGMSCAADYTYRRVLAAQPTTHIAGYELPSRLHILQGMSCPADYTYCRA